MLYSLIPPILIVASLIGIILMLLKKSSQVADLPFEDEPEDGRRKPGLTGAIGRRVKNIRLDGTKQLLLRILEKITSKTRIIFLKLESRFALWSNDIRSKRQAREQKSVLRREAKNSEIAEKSDIIEKLRDYKLGKRDNRTAEKVAAEERTTAAEEINVDRDRKEKIISAKPAEERVAKPMISDKVVAPRRRAEMKDRLEELLIERIAVNPKDIEAYERLGEYYMEIKSYTDAKECIKQVLKLNPSDRNAKYKMRRLENILAKK